jgi:hypothetical protein
MRKIVLGAATLGAMTLSFIGACSKNEEQPPPAQPGQYPAYQQQPGYPAQQQQPGYPAQQYPQQQQPGYPAAQPTYPQQQPGYPAAPAPGAAAPGATPSQPSAVAFPCSTDIQCLSHRCNVQVGKCSWPCQSNDDCQPGFQCVAPACVPTLPQQ